MNIEEAFVRDILERPDDVGPRLIYADWLEEQGGLEGPARAAWLRTEVELLKLDEEDEQRAPLLARLRELGPHVSSAWLTALAQSQVEGCSALLKQRCPQRWGRLSLTQVPTVRFCEVCRREVHYCRTIQEGRAHLRVGHCIAVDCAVERRPGDTKPRRPRRPVRRMGGR
jgi:uncharacterized protein (TIGR02996 family)